MIKTIRKLAAGAQVPYEADPNPAAHKIEQVPSQLDLVIGAEPLRVVWRGFVKALLEVQVDVDGVVRDEMSGFLSYFVH